MIYRLIRAFLGQEAGACCRSCRDPIPSSDEFGLSEGVCSACRS
jgi:hypothetical protein